MVRNKTAIRKFGRQGLTVVELLVVTGILAMLVALLVPAVQKSRTAAWKMECAANLKQLGIAVLAYESQYRVLPPGSHRGYSAHVWTLPFLDGGPLFAHLNLQPAASNQSHNAFGPSPRYLRCPADGSVDQAACSYAANCGNGPLKFGFNGPFRRSRVSTIRPDGLVTISMIRRGLDNTAGISEILTSQGEALSASPTDPLRVNWEPNVVMISPAQWDSFVAICDTLSNASGFRLSRGLPWFNGTPGYTMYTHSLTPNRKSCINGSYPVLGVYTAASHHDSGVNVLYTSGKVRFTGHSVDSRVWQECGAIASEFSSN